MQNVGCNVGTGIQGKKQLETWWWSSPLRLDNTDFNTPPIYHPPIFHSSLWSIIFQNRTLNAECLSHHCGCHRFPLFKLLFLFLLLTQPILSPPQSQSHSNFQKTAAACKSLSTQHQVYLQFSKEAFLASMVEGDITGDSDCTTEFSESNTSVCPSIFSSSIWFLSDSEAPSTFTGTSVIFASDEGATKSESSNLNLIFSLTVTVYPPYLWPNDEVVI